MNLEPSDIWLTGTPYNSINEIEEAFNTIFSMPSILIFASMSAYLVAQLIDIKVFHFIKKITKSKYLWLRNNLSTMFSQLIDTIIVNTIFLGFGMGIEYQIVCKIIIANYIVKIIFAMIDTPLVYFFVFIIKKKCGVYKY
jgi:uncharacterized integral membrane protein (TIGR00697 family)